MHTSPAPITPTASTSTQQVQQPVAPAFVDLIPAVLPTQSHASSASHLSCRSSVVENTGASSTGLHYIRVAPSCLCRCDPTIFSVSREVTLQRSSHRTRGPEQERRDDEATVTAFLESAFVDSKALLGPFLRAGIRSGFELDGLAHASEARVESILECVCSNEGIRVSLYERMMIREALERCIRCRR